MTKKKNSKIIPISDALQTLSDIVEVDSSKSKVIKQEIDEKCIGKLFESVYKYVEKSGRSRVKTVMALVGDAAKKLDKYSDLFHLKSAESVTKLAEYRRLQDLYSRKIEKQVDSNVLGKWILGLTKATSSSKEIRMARMRKEERTKHVFVDLDMVKRDNEYELLLMRKEDGSRFYSPRLIRNIRIVSDFGITQTNEADIFMQVDLWRQAVSQTAATNMLKSLNLTMHRFYQDVFRHKSKDFIGDLNKAFMALFLAAQTRPTTAMNKGKTSDEYFADFQYYLRCCLNRRFYQKLLLFPPKKNNHIALCTLDVAQHICRTFYLHMNVMNELYDRTLSLLSEAEQQYPTTTLGQQERGALTWSRLAYDYAELIKALKKHESGPLKRILETLKQGSQTTFDPLIQNNLPHQLFEACGSNFLRMPCPTRQTQVNKAVVTDEFKGYLLSTSRYDVKAHHLLINLQDRTSWREFARCNSVEKLQSSELFKEHLTTVTLATDTDFYHQCGPYFSEDEFKGFSKRLIEQLKDSSSGYFIPENLKLQVQKFTPKAVAAIHKAFFFEEKYLDQKERQSFIMLFHTFLTLFLVEKLKPTSVSMSCKDSLDVGETYSVLLYLIINQMNHNTLSEEEMNYIKSILYGPSILIRERAPLADVINRLFGAIRTIEAAKERLGHVQFTAKVKDAFKGVLDTKTLTSDVSVPVYSIDTLQVDAA